MSTITTHSTMCDFLAPGETCRCPTVDVDALASNRAFWAGVLVDDHGSCDCGTCLDCTEAAERELEDCE